MPNKMLPLSVRISLDDAAFLSSHSIAGAKTPSEKIRALIRQARHRQEGVHDYAEGLVVQEEEMSLFIHGLREAENRVQQHSEFLLQLAQWLPEATAFLLANIPGTSEEDGQANVDSLKKLERSAADRVITLMETVLRMAIVPHNPCYDPALLNERLKGVLELCELIRTIQTAKGENTS